MFETAASTIPPPRQESNNVPRAGKLIAMVVLVADKFEKSGLDGIAKLGAEVVYEPALVGDQLGDRIRSCECDALVVRSTKVTADMLEDAKLGLIIRAGAGINTIDVNGASDRGIMVTNCPGKNSHAVAELAFGLILAIDRQIPDNVIELRNKHWDKKRFSGGRGVYGRTLGLIGMGKIGQEMTALAKAFGMHVVAYSRWMTPDVAAALGIGRAASVDEVAQLSDVISVHVALTPDTERFLNKDFFDKVKPDSIFINTSRGEVVDQSAMFEAIKSKGLRVGLDVFDDEPDYAEGEYNGEMLNHPEVYCTHHIGASTVEAQEAIASEVVRIVGEYMAKGSVPNVVNVKRAEVATHLLVVRHLDRVGVLAHILSILKDEGINVQEMENIVLGGAKTAIAQISVDSKPGPEALLRMKKNENVFDASVFSIR